MVKIYRCRSAAVLQCYGSAVLMFKVGWLTDWLVSYFVIWFIGSWFFGSFILTIDIFLWGCASHVDVGSAPRPTVAATEGQQTNNDKQVPWGYLR
jgi:hypothetical protein